MSAPHADGRAALPALFAISFGGVLALFAAFMFFAIEGWAFGVLAVSQMFVAFGTVALGRRLHKRAQDGGAAAAAGALHS